MFILYFSYEKDIENLGYSYVNRESKTVLLDVLSRFLYIVVIDIIDVDVLKKELQEAT